jgi:hypothetical protein
VPPLRLWSDSVSERRFRFGLHFWQLPVASWVERESAATGVPAEAMADSTLYLMGTGAEVREQLHQWRRRIGISYVSLFDPGEEQIEYLAEQVVAPLSGP